MAIDFFNTYPQNTGAKSEDYPFGSFRNETAPNAEDGTTLEQKWSNDWLAFFSRLLVEAAMTPSGDVDTVKVSQYYDALLALIHRERREVSNALDGTRTDVAASEDALRRTHELASSKVSKAGDTMTGYLTILDSTPSLHLRNNTIPANNVGARSVLHNAAGNTVLSLTNEGWTQEFRQVFPRKSGTIALTSDGLGVAQTWQDVTSWRVQGATYRNDTGKPICLSLWMQQEWGGSRGFSVFIDGINVVYSDTEDSSDPSVFAIIPTGSTYKVEIFGVSLGANAFWFEMR